MIDKKGHTLDMTLFNLEPVGSGDKSINFKMRPAGIDSELNCE
ncbi:MAG: hypothetical protein US49_C0001G0196 [candidate division TM6 bacterium GW2011_GWF2_37_49]|nr:MAG: hypothetical protein US49_C0001G0196 [candidate division TM6 bacterium GW2011_GWF2_37_49]